MISYVLTTLNRHQHLTVLRKCLVVLLLVHFTMVRRQNFVVWSVVVDRSKPFRRWFFVVCERRRIVLEVTALYVGNGVEDMAVNDRVGKQIGLRKKELFA